MRDKLIDLYKVRGEENPADLFTKHLSGHDRIEKLLELFGCVYRGGRPDAAPRMRQGIGTSKGELLAVQAEQAAELVEWGGYKFPSCGVTGEAHIPEAFRCRSGILPHLHSDLEQRFPQAEAGEALHDADPGTDDSLEGRGMLIGSNGVRFPGHAHERATMQGRNHHDRAPDGTALLFEGGT